jgi:hypothetical protein
MWSLFNCSVLKILRESYHKIVVNRDTYIHTYIYIYIYIYRFSSTKLNGFEMMSYINSDSYI